LKPNGEDGHVRVLSPIQRCPNDHEGDLASSLEPLHPLAGLYRPFNCQDFSQSAHLIIKFTSSPG